MAKLKVGQKVWMRYNGFDSRRSIEIKEGLVTKVGRRYFEVNNNDYTGGRFEIDTMIESGETNYRDKAYLSKDEIENEIEFGKLSSEITAVFKTYSKLPLSIEQLRAIKEIISQPINQ